MIMSSLQGDQMYLNVFNSGLVVLHLCVEYLSVDDLPKVVNISFDRNMLSYQICQTVRQRNKAAPVLNSR